MSEADHLAALLLNDNTWRRKSVRWVREALGCAPILATAEKVAGALAQAGIRHVFVGGLAVQQHGYVRNTLDVDIVVSDVDAACDWLAAHGFKENPGPVGFRRSKVKVIMTDKENGVDVDLMPAGARVGGSGLPLPQPEKAEATPQYVDAATLVSLKLSSCLAEPVNRAKDQADVVELIKAGLPQDLPVDSSVRTEYARLWSALHTRLD